MVTGVGRATKVEEIDRNGLNSLFQYNASACVLITHLFAIRLIPSYLCACNLLVCTACPVQFMVYYQQLLVIASGLQNLLIIRMEDNGLGVSGRDDGLDWTGLGWGGVGWVGVGWGGVGICRP